MGTNRGMNDITASFLRGRFSLPPVGCKVSQSLKWKHFKTWINPKKERKKKPKQKNKVRRLQEHHSENRTNDSACLQTKSLEKKEETF